MHSFTERDLKAARMNVQCSLIRELRLNEFEQGHNASEAAKKICYTNGEGVETGWFKKFGSDCKKLDD